ncbi:hypothetical protein HYU21_04735 [Candidatus Woesearchaeota archaeon]|nr:hypothetical protein [Candidatus Woesearchaeota archaeon]
MDQITLLKQKGRTVLGLASLLLSTSISTSALAEEKFDLVKYEENGWKVTSYHVQDNGKHIRHVKETDWNGDGLVDEITESITGSEGLMSKLKRTYHCNDGPHKGLTYISTTTFLPNREGFIILDETDFNGDGKIDKTEKYFRSGVTGEEKKLLLDDLS